jgi:hypothetical protein
MLLTIRFAVALVLVALVTPTVHSQSQAISGSAYEEKAGIAPGLNYPLETVYVGTAADTRPTVCGLDVSHKREPEIACTNGAVIQFFHYVPMTTVWGNPPESLRTTRHQSCPKGFRKTKDGLGQTWCMDSEGRSYTPENVRYVAKMRSGHKAIE